MYTDLMKLLETTESGERSRLENIFCAIIFVAKVTDVTKWMKRQLTTVKIMKHEIDTFANTFIIFNKIFSYWLNRIK